jgi:predicted NBD/HSP70 family sugar kinase
MTKLGRPMTGCLKSIACFPTGSLSFGIMTDLPALLSVAPSLPCALDPAFRPISLGNRAYRAAVKAGGKGVPLAIAIERNEGLTSVYRTEVFPTRSAHDGATRIYVERLVKFLLWQIGGWKITVGGPAELGAHLKQVYSSSGARAFDVQIMERVYERTFTVQSCAFEHAPITHESSIALGGHLDGCRIGFDLGASDYKIAAVIDGEAVFATEIPWDPRIEKDSDWHYRKINEGLKLAASKLPRVDAIGGSSAGIYIDNKVMVASLFRFVPADEFAAKVKPLFLRLQQEWQVPLEVANDGDVTALAGAMSLGVSGVLGIAMGSSQAVGFLDKDGRITGWLNELAFAPVDYNPKAAADEWSGDIGCGVQYFSQQAVVKLAPDAGITLPPGHPAEQLKHVQELHKSGDARAIRIFETIGVYLGYALAHYADLYDYSHVLILGRVTSGSGGDLILANAQEVLAKEFPDLAGKISVSLPDEKSKRLGQAVAAASLPALSK